MKVIAFLLFFSAGAFAQDGYHIAPQPKCEFEACLIAQETEIGFGSYEDREGNTVYALNSDAGFTNVLYEGASVCFRGESAAVSKILKELKFNDEMDFSDGGHQLVEELKLELEKDFIGYKAKVYSDYGNYELAGTINRCNTARAVSVEKIFREMYNSPELSSRHCGINTQKFLSALYSSEAEFKEAYAVSVHEDSGMLNHFDARWGDTELYENGVPYKRANYFFHVFAVVDGKAYDFSQAGMKNSDLQDYLMESYVPKFKTGNIFFQGRMAPEKVLKDHMHLEMNVYPGKRYAAKMGTPMYSGRFIEIFNSEIKASEGAALNGKKILGVGYSKTKAKNDGSLEIYDPELRTIDGTFPALASESDKICRAFGFMGSMPNYTEFKVTDNQSFLKLYTYIASQDPMEIDPNQDVLVSYNITKSDGGLPYDKFHYATKVRCANLKTLIDL